MRIELVSVAALAMFALPERAHAEERAPLELHVAGTYSRFEQQVKSEVGGARGERLVEQSELALFHALSYRFLGPLSAGVFGLYNSGTRRVGRFQGLTPEGKAVVAPELGGDYLELWAGPFVRASFGLPFFELGYGLYTARWDEARDDLPNSEGDAGVFRTHRGIAWVLAGGLALDLADELELTVRLSYRVRYYNRRGGHALSNDVVHGTQDVTPFIGVAYRFGER